MKYTFALAAAAGFGQVSATGFGFGSNKFWGAKPFECPKNIDNICLPKHKGGLGWGALLPGKEIENEEHDGFKYGGGKWKCGQSNRGRDIMGRTLFGGKFLSTECGEGATPEIEVGTTEAPDAFSMTKFDLDFGDDGDLQMEFELFSGKKCRTTPKFCKKGRNTIENKQCGGAKKVKFHFKPKKGKKCKVDFHHIDFDCDKHCKPGMPGCPGECKGYFCPPKDNGECKGKNCPPKDGGECKGPHCPPKDGGECKGPHCPPKDDGECKGPHCPPKDDGECKGPKCPPKDDCEGDDCPVPQQPDDDCEGEDCPPKGDDDCEGEDCPPKGDDDCEGEDCNDVDLPTPIDDEPNTPLPTPPTGDETPDEPVTTPPVNEDEDESPENPEDDNDVDLPTPIDDEPNTPLPTPPTGDETPDEPVVTPPVDENEDESPETPDEPVDGPDCPAVVPGCLNTWLPVLGECKNSLDSKCYCKHSELINEVYDCIYANGEDDDIIAEAIQALQGICAPEIPENPAIITGGESITSCITVTGTPIITSAIYTTIVVDATVTVPCVEDGVTITGSSTVTVIKTEVPVPEVTMPPPPKETSSEEKPEVPEQPEEKPEVPVTETPKTPEEKPEVPVGETPETPEQPEQPGQDVPPPAVTPPPAAAQPTPPADDDIPVTGSAANVRAGFGLGLAVMAVMAAL